MDLLDDLHPPLTGGSRINFAWFVIYVTPCFQSVKKLHLNFFSNSDVCKFQLEKSGLVSLF